jgi:hypothetical protein|tara:strand:- start:95 stop:721 length:627 start_codon:yes stop_codon:yes gene_type:complete
MGKIKKDIKNLSKESGSKVKARRAAESWFEKASKSIKDKSVAKYSKPFKVGMIHVFRYEKPKHVKTLLWWDMNPVVLALDTHPSGTDVGINLNLLPVQFKEDLLDMIYDNMEGQIKSKSGRSKENDALSQGEIKLIYKDAVEFLRRFGFDFAIRQYIPQLKKNQKVVSYEHWAKIALCDYQDLYGIGINEVKRSFAEHLKTRSKRKDI